MKKIRTSFNLSEKLICKLNSIPRNILPNKSKLIEELLEKWIEQITIKKKLPSM